MKKSIKNLQKASEFLPSQVQELVRVVGMAAALNIVAHYGGTTLCVPTRFRVEHPLLKLMSEPQYRRLVRHYRGERLEIPRCIEALRVIKGQQIYQEFLSGVSQSELAKKYGITRRWVIELCRREKHRLSGEQKQMELF